MGHDLYRWIVLYILGCTISFTYAVFSDYILSQFGRVWTSGPATVAGGYNA
jgi:hypothetical protein